MIERTIISHLVYNDDYARRVLPFLKSDYFHDPVDKQVFNLVEEYVNKYNGLPSKEALSIELNQIDDLNATIFDKSSKYIKELSCENTDIEWLLNNTEKFCKDKAIYNAIMESIQILDGADGKSLGAIPQVMQEALAVSFDNNIGHDYIENADQRYEFYHRKEEKIPFDIHLLNKITDGGISRKTLTILLAGTGVGKSLCMCHMAAANLLDGKNVLYITMEMAEEKIAERIDANLMNVDIKDLKNMSLKAYNDKIAKIRSKTVGKLVIKEYPTASAGSGHFRHLLNELRLKKNFKPDIIYIDYLNICISSRIKAGANVNSYQYVKAIAEELRGLGGEFNVPIVSATQTNRSGFSDSDVGLENTSESFGLPMTADLMFAVIGGEDLDALGQFMIKQLKNRYSDPNYYKRFVVGVNKARMQLYDVEEEAQNNIQGAGTSDDESSVFDKSSFGQADSDREKKERFKTLFQ